MLASLHISNYVLIDSLDVDFPEGLVIVTGQTGAGKSILLGALSLLFGGKGDASVISPGADNCVVEGEFRLSDTDSLIFQILSDNDIDSDGNVLTIRRVLSGSGRSRCFVNDLPVGLHCLQDLSRRLVDIHSQHRSLLLGDSDFQLAVLDRFADNSELLQSCSSLWRQLRDVDRQLEQMRESLRTMSADNEYNAAQYRQLDEAGLRDGELEELEQEQKALANAGQIQQELSSALSCIRTDDESVPSRLREAQRCLDRLSSLVPASADLSARCQSASIELDDIADSIESAAAAAESDPRRMQDVEDRLSLLYGLLRKHSCGTEAELIALRDSLAQSACGPEDLAAQILDLEKRRSGLSAQYDAVCAQLSSRRRAAVPAFASSITESLRFLELERAVFDVSVVQAAPSAVGVDAVSYLFTSTGTNPVEISRCASGGELSRIMLCLKQMMARYFGMPTMIFDEIDTGVSGSVADKMGRMICEMGDDMQVFSITHLPQVAAKGSAHYLVSKSFRQDGTAATSIQKLSGDDRVMEIARMLSGSTITPAAIDNARALLSDNPGA